MNIMSNHHSRLDKLLEEKKFEEAIELFKSELLTATIIHPFDDSTWTSFADTISRYIAASNPFTEYEKFWLDLLEFFETKLEKKYSCHLHKGHIFFRLGSIKLNYDILAGKQYLEKALDEDRLLAAERWKDDTEQIDKEIQQKSSYIMLCIIEKIEEDDLIEPKERQKFFATLSTAFNAAIYGKRRNYSEVYQALRYLTPMEVTPQAIEYLKAADISNKQNLKLPTIALSGALLETIIFGILYYDLDVAEIKIGDKNKDIRDLTFGQLLREAINRDIFPSESIKSTCELIQAFRNRLHAGNEDAQEYKVSLAVSRTIKNLFDLMIYEWGFLTNNDYKSRNASLWKKIKDRINYQPKIMFKDAYNPDWE